MTNQKPEVDHPGGEPPADLQITDITDGGGAGAATGAECDSSWTRGAPLSFRLGVGMVIPGWDQGVRGMRGGGRRQLVIPARLAYGDRGAGGAIAPGETLIFVCDLVAV